MIRQEFTWFDRIKQDMEIFNMIWQNSTRFGKIWQDLTGLGRIWQDLTGFDSIQQDLTRFGRIWQNLTWFDMIWQDMTEFNKIQQDLKGFKDLTGFDRIRQDYLVNALQQQQQNRNIEGCASQKLRSLKNKSTINLPEDWKCLRRSFRSFWVRCYFDFCCRIFDHFWWSRGKIQYIIFFIFFNTIFNWIW